MDPKARETIICIEETPSKKFKQFDIIADKHPKPRRYLLPSVISNHNQTQLCSETISLMKEWNILRDSLPDSIFVRAYDETIDLLRAVIIGPPGTPYHNGLYFYDIQITSGYPYTRPRIWLTYPGSLRTENMGCYRARPCSRLKADSEKKYSILEILLLQQANLINSEPKPVLDHSDDILPTYCEYLLEKDYSAFDISCQIMLGVLREPPKHFEEFVAEHFRDRAKSILYACKSYIGDAESKVADDVVNNDNRCVQIAMKVKERKRYQKSMKSIYYNLFEAFMKNGSNNSLENIYNIGDISMDDIDGMGSCSSIFLSCFAYCLLCVFITLSMGLTYRAPDHADNFVLALTICLVATLCFGLAFLLLKIPGCDCYFRTFHGKYGWVHLS